MSLSQVSFAQNEKIFLASDLGDRQTGKASRTGSLPLSGDEANNQVSVT